MDTQLELVHFQITRNCNLRCWFCGQWGHTGFFRGAQGDEMELADWKSVAADLVPGQTDIILWGGEPLVSPLFDVLTDHLAKRGFSLGMVTNGTLLAAHMARVREKFRVVYISLDGPRDIHDAIRGQGVFDTVVQQIECLRGGNAKIIINTVVSDQLLPRLPEFLRFLEDLQPDSVNLQQMIPYDDDCPPMVEALHLPPCKIPIRCIKHGDGAHCGSPWRHAHVTWNGAVTFCTDYYDYSIGNVRQHSLKTLWKNEKANAFRQLVQQGGRPECTHCSWRTNEKYKF